MAGCKGCGGCGADREPPGDLPDMNLVRAGMPADNQAPKGSLIGLNLCPGWTVVGNVAPGARAPLAADGNVVGNVAGARRFPSMAKGVA